MKPRNDSEIQEWLEKTALNKASQDPSLNEEEQAHADFYGQMFEGLKEEPAYELKINLAEAVMAQLDQPEPAKLRHVTVQMIFGGGVAASLLLVFSFLFSKPAFQQLFASGLESLQEGNFLYLGVLAFVMLLLPVFQIIDHRLTLQSLSGNVN